MGETKRKLKVRVKEHRTETEKVSQGTVFTRDKKRQSQSEMWSSVTTDHAVDWDSAKIVNKERDDQARGIKEALFISKVPNKPSEGRYHLSHLYDNILGAVMHT